MKLLFDHLRKTGIIGFVRKNDSYQRSKVDTHQDSWAFVAGGLLVAAALGAGAFYAWCTDRKGRAVLCALGTIVSLVAGVYFAFSYEGSLDRQDEQAKATAVAAGLKVIEVDGGEIRVGKKLANGKLCEATFNMAGWDHSKLPFPEGSGRNPSKGCGIDDLEDIDGGLPHQDAVTDQERALDRIFAPK